MILAVCHSFFHLHIWSWQHRLRIGIGFSVHPRQHSRLDGSALLLHCVRRRVRLQVAAVAAGITHSRHFRLCGGQGVVHGGTLPRVLAAVGVKHVGFFRLRAAKLGVDRVGNGVHGHAKRLRALVQVVLQVHHLRPDAVDSGSHYRHSARG